MISRGRGQSCVAAAAYRGAQDFHDLHTGQRYNFTRKSDVIEREVLLPATAPEWMHDSEALWNAVEASEKRKDAQLSREIHISLPIELTESQNWELVKSFVQKTFVDQGMIADINFHRGHQSRAEQPHAHIMLTMREVTEDGFGLKVRGWNDKVLLEEWREQWSEHCNVALAEAGFDIRIDHRTLEAQGINLEPQSKIGPLNTEVGRRRLEEHQALAVRNGHRLLDDPMIALIALTHQQSTFTHQDIARFVSRHTGDSEQFTAVFEKIKTHPELVSVGMDDHQRERWSTRTMLALEKKMLKQADNLSRCGRYYIETPLVKSVISTRTLSAQQEQAVLHLTQGAEISCVIGFAGTGKSYLLGAAREAWMLGGYQVQGMALSGVAAHNLEGESGIPSQTVSRGLWTWEQKQAWLTKKDILVVDEAGMLGSRQMARIVAEVHRAKAKLVLIGDPEQLQAIEAGAAYRAIAERVGAVTLTEVRRQTVDWQQDATRSLATGYTQEALKQYEQHDHIHLLDTDDAAMTAMVQQWDEARSASPKQSSIILAYTRDAVKILNERARAMRHTQGELGTDRVLETARGERVFAENDRLYFLRNENRVLNVKNGTLGTVERIDGNTLTVILDRNKPTDAPRTVRFQLSDYDNIDHGYAATIHKAQGITVDRSYVLASPYHDRHSCYVALTRHRESVDLYYSRGSFRSFEHLKQVLSRERSKDVTLDYGLQRGFDVPEDRIIQDRMENESEHVPWSSQPLTEERYRQAEMRLAERQAALDFQNDLSAFQRKTGLSTDFEFSLDSTGIYRGKVSLAGKHYGVMEQLHQRAILIPINVFRSEITLNQSMRMIRDPVFDMGEPDKPHLLAVGVRELEKTVLQRSAIPTRSISSSLSRSRHLEHEDREMEH